MPGFVRSSTLMSDGPLRSLMGALPVMAAELADLMIAVREG